MGQETLHNGEEFDKIEGVEGNEDLIAKEKVSRSEFGKSVLAKRISLVLSILVLLGIGIGIFHSNMDDAKYQALETFFFTEIFTVMLLTYIGIGFTAQMVDGALGMAYGATSQSLLGAAGVSPGMSIQAIKISEVFTTAASGFSHWKMGNINKKLVKNLIIPGAIGAAIGSIILVYLSSLEKFSKLYLKPAISFYVLLLGIYIIYKATRQIKRKKTTRLAPLAGFGGFMDAIGGGGWGPIVTSTLLSKGRNPKYTIGSVNLSEFFIALVGAVTLTWAVGMTGWKIIAGMILGGIIAAPFGAVVAGKVKAKPLMILVGTLIIIVNVYQLSKAYKAIKKEWATNTTQAQK